MRLRIKTESTCGVCFVSAEQRRDFKAYALERDMDANELFLIIWDYYREKNG